MKRLFLILCAAAQILSAVSFVYAEDFEVGISVKTDVTPAVFYDNNTAKFEVELTGSALSTEQYSVEYEIKFKNYNYDSYKSAVDEILKKSFTRSGVTFSDSIVFEDTLYYDLSGEKYGLYNLNITVKNGSTVVGEKSFPFAKSTVAENLNRTFGSGVHLTRYADADIVLSMMKNSGLGLVRDDFNWDKYEKSKGVYKLDERQVSVLEKAKKYDIDMLAILTGGNSLYNTNAAYSSLPDDSTYDGSGKTFVDAYKNYASSFVNEPQVKSAVTMVEVINEPLGSVSESGKTEAQIKAEYVNAGKIYAKSVKAAYDAVKENNSPIKVGAFSAFRLGYQADYFIDGAMSEMDKQYYDAFTIHDYKERGTDGDPEPGYSPSVGANYYPFLDGAVSTVEHFDDLMSGKTAAPSTGNYYTAFPNKERWYTERGFSTDDKPDGAENFSKNPYYDQALNLVRSKIVLDAYNGGNMIDKAWIYDFSDDNISDSIRESSFGIVESHLDENPYAPKPAYIAVANYNSLVADATKCEKVDGDNIYEENGEYIYKYTCPSRTVYVAYHSKGDDPAEVRELEFERINNGNVTVYDFWGNEINESDIYKNGKYQLTKQPYYICVGEPINRSVKPAFAKEVMDKITVEGNIASKERGRMVSIVVLKPGEELDENSVSTSLYFNQTTTDTDGYFRFEFGVSEQGASCKAYVTSDDNPTPISFNISSGRTEKISLSFMKDIVKLKNSDFKLIDLSNISAMVEYSTAANAIPYKLYCAVYKDNSLVGFESLSGRIESMQDGNKVYPISISGAGSSVFDRVTLYMFDADGKLEPICSVCTINK